MSRPDQRTTPPPARPLVLVGLGLVAAYLGLGLASAVWSLSGEASESRWFWLGRFRMFTDLRPHHIALQARIESDGQWRDLDLATVYPSAWQEGPGYDRGSFWKDAGRVSGLAESLCQRTGAAAVQLSVARWEKTLASHTQPMVNPEHRELLVRRCD